MRLSTLFAAVALLGCGSPRGGIGTFPVGDGSAACAAGEVAACRCDDGRAGMSVCSAQGLAGPCVCGAPGIDGGLPGDLGGARPDALSTADLGAPHGDVGAGGAGSVGSSCARLSDCTQGVCLPSGRCSRPCVGVSDCPGSWSCASLPGLGPVCSCTPRGAEVCNNLDDDCDGEVDEGTARCGGSCVDVRSDPMHCGACGVSCGAGTSCVNGACACPSDRPLACGGRCVDGRTDPSHCGACGNACASGAQCVGGVCQRTGMCPSSCSQSAQCAPCATPGETGSYCCVSGLCIYMAASTCSGPAVDAGLPDVTLPEDSGAADGGGGASDVALD